MNLVNLYNNIQNPLDNNQILDNLIDIYKTCGRTTNNFDHVDCSIYGDKRGHGLYSQLTKQLEPDNTVYNNTDKETFLIDLYNTWIKNMTSMTDEQKKQVSKRYKDLDGLINKLKRVGKVTKLEDINALRTSPDDNSYEDIEYWQNGAFNHIDSRYVSGTLNRLDDVKHRIYIGAKAEDIYKLAYEFKKECEARNIPYYFKFDQIKQKRVDTFVVYTDDQNFGNHIDVLNSIKSKYPNIASNCGRPSDIVGHYDGWLGIADEPEELYSVDGKHLYNPSYNQVKAVMIEEAMDSTIINEIKKFSNSQQILIQNGHKFNIYGLLKKYLYETLSKEARSYYMHPALNKNIENLTGQNKENFENQLKTYVKNLDVRQLQDLLGQFIINIGSRYQIDKNNENNTVDCERKVLFGHKFNATYVDENGKMRTLENRITLRTVDFALKNMIDVLKQNDPDFYAVVRKNFNKVMQNHKVDPDKFVLNGSTRDLMLGKTSQNIQKSNANQTSQQNTNIQKNSQQPSQTQNSQPTNANTNTFAPAGQWITGNMGFTPAPKPKEVTSTIVLNTQLLNNAQTINAKIDYLSKLNFVRKTKSDFKNELENSSGITREDCSSVYADVKGSLCNVKELEYKEIEKTIFTIVNMKDYNVANDLLIRYNAVLRKINYEPSFGTLSRALKEMDKLEKSGLEHCTSRIELLRDTLANGYSMLSNSENIAKYIKSSNNITGDVTREEQSKVLAKMQENYDKFAFVETPKTGNYSKFFDETKIEKPLDLVLIQKSDTEMQDSINLHSAYKDYGYTPCPYQIKDSNGEMHDIWEIGSEQLLERVKKTIVSDNKNELTKMRIICENMKKHFKPSYSDVAKLVMIVNDFENRNPDTDRILQALKGLASEKYNEALQIAKFNAQNNGKPYATTREVASVLEELEMQNQARKQTTKMSSGYSDGM